MFREVLHVVKKEMNSNYFSHQRPPRPSYYPPIPHGPPPPHVHTHYTPSNPQFPPHDPRRQPRIQSPWKQEPIPPGNVYQLGFHQPFFSQQHGPSLMFPPQVPSGMPPRHGLIPAVPLMMSPGPVPPGPPGSVFLPSEPYDPFVSDWLKRVGETRSKVMQRKETNKGLKIPEVRLLLSRTAYLVTTLRSLHSRLTMVAEDDSVTWSDLSSQVQRYKAELESLRARLGEPGLIERLVKKVGRVAARRERSKRAKRAREVEKSERMSVAEERADNWLREKRQEELRHKTEESVQASAKAVMEEVKRKQTEVGQLKDLLTSLEALREHRKETRRKGEVLPPDTDELYTRRYETLTDLLSGQLSEYQEEEHTLRVLMKEEVKEKMSSQIDAALSVALPSLTGPPGEGPPTLSDPHAQYWLQAELSEDCKAAIRQNWSCFEHPEGSPLLTETTPPIDCTRAWKQFILNSHQEELRPVL